MIFLVDLTLKYFDFFMFFEDLGVKCLVIGSFMHPISQFLNLLLLLRQLDAWCTDACGEFSILKLSCCRKVILLAIVVSCIKDSFTNKPLSYLVVFNPFYNFVSINWESCWSQQLDVIFIHNYTIMKNKCLQLRKSSLWAYMTSEWTRDVTLNSLLVFCYYGLSKLMNSSIPKISPGNKVRTL